MTQWQAALTITLTLTCNKGRSVLYRSRKHAGMALEEATEEHKRQRLIRRHQLATSKDQVVRAIHEQFEDRQKQREKWGKLGAATKSKTNEWKECLEMQKLLAEVKTGKMVGKPSDGSGVGYRPPRRSCAVNKFKAEREEMLAVFSEITEQERLRKIISTPLEASEVGTHPFEK